MTEETPEQAAESKYGLSDSYSKNRIGFIEGAKWMQERMYSEEDLREAFFSAIKSTGEGWNGEYANGKNPNVETVFRKEYEQYYNKTYGGNNEQPIH